MSKKEQGYESLVEEKTLKLNKDKEKIAFVSQGGLEISCGLCGQLSFNMVPEKPWKSDMSFDCDYCCIYNLTTIKVGDGQCVSWAGLCKNDPFKKCDGCL